MTVPTAPTRAPSLLKEAVEAVSDVAATIDQASESAVPVDTKPVVGNAASVAGAVATDVADDVPAIADETVPAVADEVAAVVTQVAPPAVDEVAAVVTQVAPPAVDEVAAVVTQVAPPVVDEVVSRTPVSIAPPALQPKVTPEITVDRAIVAPDESVVAAAEAVVAAADDVAVGIREDAPLSAAEPADAVFVPTQPDAASTAASSAGPLNLPPLAEWDVIAPTEPETTQYFETQTVPTSVAPLEMPATGEAAPSQPSAPLNMPFNAPASPATALPVGSSGGGSSSSLAAGWLPLGLAVSVPESWSSLRPTGWTLPSVIVLPNLAPPG